MESGEWRVESGECGRGRRGHGYWELHLNGNALPYLIMSRCAEAAPSYHDGYQMVRVDNVSPSAFIFLALFVTLLLGNFGEDANRR